MCRLMCFASTTPSGATGVLGEAAFDEFVDLSRLHGDGWGYAVSDSAGDVAVYRSPRAARQDDHLTTLRGDRSRAGLVHLRWASLGLPVREENTHPFVARPRGPIAFAHNGSVAEHDEIEPLLDVELRALRRGDTDSELYFLLLLQSLTRYPDLGDALRATVTTIRTFAPVASLNAVVLTDDELCVVHSHTGMPMPTDDLEETCGALENIPPAHLDRYFDLSWSERPGGVVAAHSGLPGEWETMPPDSILRVRRSDLTTTMSSL